MEYILWDEWEIGLSVTIGATEFVLFVNDEKYTLEDRKKVIAIINAGMCIKAFANVLTADVALGMNFEYGEIHGVEGNKFLRILEHVYLLA